MIEHLTDRQLTALRTRSAPAAEAFELLEHAASCLRCRELIVSKTQMALEMASLKQTIRGSVAHLSLGELNDFVDGTLPFMETQRVDAHLSECQACSRDVIELKRLAEPAISLETPKQTFGEWVTGISTLFRMPRMAFPMVIFVLMAVLTGWLVLRNHRLDSQSANLNGGSGATVPQKTAPETKPPLKARDEKDANGGKVRGSVLAVALVPGLVRGSDSEKIFTVPAQTETLRIRLTSRSELTAGRYGVSVLDDARQSVWHGQVAYKTAQDAIVVQVPAKLLRAGRYVVSLSAIEAGGVSENLEEYSFRVVR